MSRPEKIIISGAAMFTFKRFIDEIAAKKSFVGEGEFFAKRRGNVLELFTFENSNVACFSTFC